MNTQHFDELEACTTLSNGVLMPWLGLGTAGQWTPKAKASEKAGELGSQEGVAEAVSTALDIGYRHIDTAALYGNEEAVGRGIAAHRVDREEVFISTKVWNDAIAARPEATRDSIEGSLKRLGVARVDLLFLHWPVPGFREAWRVLEDAYEEGKARAIGVSNFQIHHFEDLLDHARVAPMVDQVEFHPQLVQPELISFCRDHKILHQGWSPLRKH
ncbi:MAG: aldo/keto reductase [Ectothiorhodospiraceae bacterium]|nr:aldo/keto reductase [Ectothiorhodospiraceae bacterium]